METQKKAKEKTPGCPEWISMLSTVHFLYEEFVYIILDDAIWNEEEETIIMSFLYSHPLFETTTTQAKKTLIKFIYDLILFYKMAKVGHPVAIYPNSCDIIERIEKNIRPKCLWGMLGEETRIRGKKKILDHRYFMMISRFWKKEDEDSVVSYLKMLPILKKAVERDEIAKFICSILLHIKYAIYDVSKTTYAYLDNAQKLKKIKKELPQNILSITRSTNQVVKANSMGVLVDVCYKTGILDKKSTSEAKRHIDEQLKNLKEEAERNKPTPNKELLKKNFDKIFTIELDCSLIPMCEDEKSERKSSSIIKQIINELRKKSKSKDSFRKLMDELLALSNNRSKSGILIVGVEDMNNVNGSVVLKGITSDDMHPNDFDLLLKEIDNFMREIVLIDSTNFEVVSQKILKLFIYIEPSYVVVDGVRHNLLVFRVDRSMDCTEGKTRDTFVAVKKKGNKYMVSTKTFAGVRRFEVNPPHLKDKPI